MTRLAFELYDGSRMPFLAFGTGSALYKQDATKAVGTAIAKGLVHLDGAQMYENEETLGAAIIESGKPREAFFVTTKLSALPEGQTPKDTLLKSLSHLKIDYVDLFLIHAPRVYQRDTLKQVWRGMEEAKLAGLTKNIGLSNSGIPELKAVLEEAEKPRGVKPAVNQLEFHPYFYNIVGPIYEFSKSNGILTSSYGGLTPIVRAKGGPVEPVLETIGERLSLTSGKSVSQGQVLGKWLQSKGIIFTSTTSREERLDEYLAIPGLPDLTPEEVKLIEETGAKNQVQYYAWVFPLTPEEEIKFQGKKIKVSSGPNI